VERKSRAWIKILDRITTLEIDCAVPGHGPIGTLDDLRPLRAYLFELDWAMRENDEQPELPERFRSWGQDEMWARNIAALREAL
jgi:cyclase